MNPRYVGLLFCIVTPLICICGFLPVFRAIVSVLFSLISSLYCVAHSVVNLTSLRSSSLFLPNRMRSSAKKRWLILWAIFGSLIPHSYASTLSFLVSISGITLNHSPHLGKSTYLGNPKKLSSILSIPVIPGILLFLTPDGRVWEFKLVPRKVHKVWNDQCDDV